MEKIHGVKYFIPNIKAYKKAINEDEYARSTFRGKNGILDKYEKRAVEFKAVKLYRLYQVNINNFWGKVFRKIAEPYMEKYGMELLYNPSIGRGFVIGHWGRIVMSGAAKIGDQVMLTHGVTIGRDVRGKRKGDPIIGNRVAIRANSTVVGGITIGDDVVIAPNTFVNFDVPSNSIVVGNPATIHPRLDASAGHVGRLPNG